MPVRVLWGDRDPVLPFAQALDLPEGFELHVAAGAGHLLIEEAQDAVLARPSAGGRHRTTNCALTRASPGPVNALSASAKGLC